MKLVVKITVIHRYNIKFLNIKMLHMGYFKMRLDQGSPSNT